MKKAKRLLAMILAFVMLASGACVSVYARQAGTTYTPASYDAAHKGSDEKFFFTAEEGCAYILDLLDNLLANANIKYAWGDLIDNSTAASAVKSASGLDYLDLTSIDHAVETIWQLCHAIQDNDNILWRAALAIAGGLLGDIRDLPYGNLNTGIKRGLRPNYTGASADLDVLYMVLRWLLDLRGDLQKIITGDFDFGVLDSALPDMIKDIPGWISGLLYSKLIDSDQDSLPSGTTIDGALQNLINWALIDGTGESAATGGNSVLGSNFEGLLPAMGDEPGGASITATSIRALRKNGSGNLVMTTTTMDTYQLVSNAINGALNTLVAPLLKKLIAGLVGAEATDQYPYGDPAIMAPSQDMFTLKNIASLVASLFHENGAPEFEPTEAQEQYPLTYIDALMDYLFTGSNRALDVFIDVNYYGINLTDNLVSLLNDVARLAVNLIPGLGLLNGADQYAYTQDELNAVTGYDKETKTFVASDDPAWDCNAYQTYEDGTLIYRADNFTNENPIYYYCSTGRIVDSADYNLVLARPAYILTSHNIYACLLKMVFNHFIAGCYFPEWCDDVAGTCAYALASLAATIVPQNNYFDRLDGWHLTNGAATYTIPETGVTVSTLAYMADKTFNGVTYSLPRAAMDIGASVLAYYCNSFFKLNNRYLTTDSTFERFATEFLMWGATEYMPILFGSRQSNGTYSTGTFSAYTNNMANAIYSDLANRTLKASPNWDYIYTMIDNSLLKLIPASWIPTAYNSTFKLINGWLFHNVAVFDLQGVMSILSVNEGGELTQPLGIVLLRVVDRLLATVFGNHAILPDTSRSNVWTTNTTVTTFTNLLSEGTLSTLIYQLVTYLYNYRVEICETLFPLLLSSLELPYRTSILGNNMTAYGIGDLENYIKVWSDNLNATLIGSYTNLNAAQEVRDAGENRYIDIVRERQNGTIGSTSTYNVYEEQSYLTSATRSQPIYDAKSQPGNAGTVGYTFSAFNHASATTATQANPLSSWTDGYIFARYEDANPNFYFNNRKDALKDAGDFVETYNEYAESSLGGAYADWLYYSINARLYAAGKYDSNDDGTINDSDGAPGVPGSDYPYVGDSTNITFRDPKIDNNVTVAMNSINGTNYEQIRIALALGNDHDNDVVLPANRAEAVVRLALNTLAFDITPDADNHYNSGSKQWGGLTAAEKSTISSFCSGLGLVYDTAENTISRPYFKQFTSSTNLGGVTPVPPTAQISGNDLSDSDEIRNKIYKAYVSYLTNLTQNRRSLYNMIDLITYRVERFENVGRTHNIDTTMLAWVLRKVDSAYTNTTSGLRNLKVVDFFNGEPVYSKVYTQSSYDKFRDAYDFALSLNTYALSGAGSDAGLTQSQVTAAYRGVYDTYKALVPYTGDADWEALDALIAQAVAILASDLTYGDDGLTAQSITDLTNAKNAAQTLRADTTIDCEGQHLVDAMAAELGTVILNLQYKNIANLVDNSATTGVQIYQSEDQTELANGRPTGIIYGFDEGTSVTSDMLIGTPDENNVLSGGALSLVGMNFNPDLGNYIQMGKGSRGYGTGAYAIGRKGGSESFRYYVVIFGDLNGDSRIDGTDMSNLLYRYTLDSSDMTTGLTYAQRQAADVNHDGAVTMADANMIQHYYTYDYGTNDMYRINPRPSNVTFE
ncbi:MAG: dockerin type I repeat-containing protein [Clostridia bacterium]|nr:dockerin type I repeat-containing protein [Clostridia bacterium]